MKKSTLQLLISVTIVAFFGWVFLFSSSKPRILVLHSLSETADWTVRIDQGIKDTLRGNRTPVTILYHYMGLDESGSEASIRGAVQSAQRSIQREKPDIIISIDDESNTLVTSRLDSANRPAVLYLATLQPPEHYGYSKDSRATGIEESIPATAIIDLLDTIYPGRNLKIAVIGVDDVTGQAEMHRLQSSHWGQHLVGPRQLVRTMAQWQAFVTEAANKADILLVLSAEMIEGDAPGEYVPEKEIISWTERHAMPLPIGIRQSYVRYGGGLAVSSPPTVYGRMGMQMALQWIQHGMAKPPQPRARISDFNVSMRTQALEVRGIKVPAVYRELARASGGLYP